MSKATRDNVAALIIIAVAIIAVVIYQYSNTMNIPFALGFESFKNGLAALICSYILTQKGGRSAIVAAMFASKPALEYHWIVFSEQAAVVNSVLVIASVYILFFWRK